MSPTDHLKKKGVLTRLLLRRSRDPSLREALQQATLLLKHLVKMFVIPPSGGGITEALVRTNTY